MTPERQMEIPPAAAHMRGEQDEVMEMAAGCGFRLKELYGDYDFGAFNEENSKFMNFLFTKLASR